MTAAIRAMTVAVPSVIIAAVLAAASSSANDLERDESPFVSYGCYQCHGYFGYGASSGPRLSAAMPYEAFRQIVRFPYGVMPAYPRELLSDEVLHTIYSFLQSRPPAPALEDLDLLYDTSRAQDRRRSPAR
jgi:ubiquinol-cytochrome c reductase cytochrome c subunit